MNTSAVMFIVAVIVGGTMFVAGVFTVAKHVIAGCDGNGQFRIAESVYRCEPDRFTR